MHREMFAHAAAAPYSGTSALGINGERPTPNAQRSIQSQSSTLDFGVELPARESFRSWVFA
jgi:hypothetical protein